MLSMRSWRTMCQRLAPTATRMLISPDRRAAFASSRLATFEHAISTTNPTAPINDQNSVRIGGPRMRSWKGSAFGHRSLLVFGYWSASLAPMLFSSARDCSTVTPSASRPTAK
jgi:hypothetical protein